MFALCTLMRSMPASILSCSTNFLACAMLLVVDILCHRLSCQEKRENSATEKVASRLKRRQNVKHVLRADDDVCDKVRDKTLLVDCRLQRKKV